MAFCPECGQPAPAQKDPTYGPGNYQQDYQGYVQQQPIPDPRQDYSPQGNIPPTAVEKKAPTGVIIGICAGIGVLVICVVVIVLLSTIDKGDADIVAKENQTAQDQKKEEKEQGVSKNEKEQDEDEEEEDDDDERSDEVVQVTGNGGKQKKASEGQDPTATPAQPKTFTGAKDRAAQQDAITTGGQLDLQHMNNLLINTGATYGSYVLDITNMQEYDGGNADTPLPASALIGVPILFTIADGVDKGEINLDTPVTLAYTFANGRGVFKSGDNGRTFPVSQMLSEALRNSDNNALNSLIDFLSLDRINTTCHSYGYNSVDIQRKLMAGTSNLENYISAKDAAMMLNTVYQDNFAGIGRSFLQTNFKISGSDTANRGMYPACGSCTMFLNLNGITDSRYNEIGLVQNGDEEFILSVFTCNGVGTTSASALTSLSSYVVNTLHAQ